MSVKKYTSGVHNNDRFIENQNPTPISRLTRTPSKTERYAAELRRRLESKEETGAAEDYLTAPLFDCDLGHVPADLMDMLQPSPPNFESLFFTPVPAAEEGLLLFQQRDSCDQCRYAVYGLIPFDPKIEHVKEAAVALFKSNGHPSLPLFHSLPTSIFHHDNWQSDGVLAFSSGYTRTLFKIAAASLWHASMATVCDFLRRHQDPWQRTLTEHATRDSEPDGAVQGRSTFNEVQFNEWFDLVTDPTHIEEERTIFRTDWREAEVSRQKEHRLISN